ncbi:hypothetical protein RIEGSTA812A_PEG_1054 [invertebrate metagenome]|uniref:Uncharacterized protein n=1 Tax=invertebrate metagenome TaxID=1711999 RepID=A0A484H7Q5_9ZZZZ
MRNDRVGLLRGQVRHSLSLLRVAQAWQLQVQALLGFGVREALLSGHFLFDMQIQTPIEKTGKYPIVCLAHLPSPVPENGTSHTARQVLRGGSLSTNVKLLGRLPLIRALFA